VNCRAPLGCRPMSLANDLSPKCLALILNPTAAGRANDIA
jgi:hypothetical protein